MKKTIDPKTILHPHPVLVIGTYNEDGTPNIMTASWGGIASSNPVCVSVCLREATLTYSNIKKTGAFTVNIPSRKYVKEADYVGIISGRDVNKFEKLGLTPGKDDAVNAPYVEEFPYALLCTLKEELNLGLHTLFAGEVKSIVASEDCLNEKGIPHIEKVDPILWGSFGSMDYYSIGEKLGKAFSIGKELEK